MGKVGVRGGYNLLGGGGGGDYNLLGGAIIFSAQLLVPLR